MAINKVVPDFKGYIEVPKRTFDQISPSAIRDRYFMMRLLKPFEVTLEQPEWLQELPKHHGVASIEWDGFIILRGRVSK